MILLEDQDVYMWGVAHFLGVVAIDSHLFVAYMGANFLLIVSTIMHGGIHSWFWWAVGYRGSSVVVIQLKRLLWPLLTFISPDTFGASGAGICFCSYCYQMSNILCSWNVCVLWSRYAFISTECLIWPDGTRLQFLALWW